jgi:DNA-binding NtrC family response regulator
MFSKPNDSAVVLIVEDEAVLRMAAVCFVEDAGFEAIEACDADDAIVLLENRDDIRLLFTDIDMPFGSMNGLRLASAVRDRWPPIKIIVVSGHRTPEPADMPGGSKFFTKPYEPDRMIATMREMLQAA